MNSEELDEMLCEDIGKLQVRDFLESCGAQPSTVRHGDPVGRMVESLLEHPDSRAVYVLDDDDVLLGMILFRDMVRLTNAKLGIRGRGVSGTLKYLRESHKDRVEEVMHSAVSVKPSASLRDALEKMEDLRLNNLPVVDDSGKLVGELSGLKVVHLLLCGT